MTLPGLLLWIARYYLVLCAGGLYTGAMLLEHYNGLSVWIVDWLFDYVEAPAHFKNLVDAMVFVVLWIFGSHIMMLWLRYVRVHNERRLYDYRRHYVRSTLLGGVWRDFCLLVRSFVADFHHYLEWLQIRTTGGHQSR